MKRKDQKSSKPEGWLEKGLTCPVQLTRQQERYCSRAIGIARFIQNLLVATHRFHRINRLQWPSSSDLAKAFNSGKKEDYPFVTAVSKFVAQGACADFEAALRHWKANGYRYGAPKIHKKNRDGSGSFLAATGIAAVQYDGNRRLKLPVIGSVKLSRRLPPHIIPVSARIRRHRGKWLLSLNFYAPPPPPMNPETQGIVGVDVGINPLTSWADHAGSQGTHPNPKAYKQAQQALRRWQRAMARRDSGLCEHRQASRQASCACPRRPPSKGWQKAKQQADKIHARIIGLRRNHHHHISRELVDNYHTIGIETLNVRGMIRAGLQSKALADAGISGLLHKIRYKAEWAGAKIVQAPQKYPSSKTCFDCGAVNRSLQREKTWFCPACGQKHNRDANAARNLLVIALGAVAPKGTGTALASGIKPPVKPARMNLKRHRQQQCNRC